MCSLLVQTQEYELGQFIRKVYLDPQSPCYVQGINTDIVDVDQIRIRADAGGGDVILDSAYALTQGLYPPTPESTITLGNGEVVTSPLGGYQYVPVESLEYWQAPSFTSWMECNVRLVIYSYTVANLSFSTSNYIWVASTAALPSRPFPLLRHPSSKRSHLT